MATMARQAVGLLTNPFLKIGQAYNKIATKHPFCTGVITTVLKTSAADIFAQRVVESKDEIDWRRHVMFCAFGFGYLGCFQYYLYNRLFTRICAPITSAVGHKGSAFVKTFLDQCIHHPLAYFPMFYWLKGTMEGRPIEQTYIKYKEELWENVKACWAVWVPAQLINFAYVPRHLRIPFVALVSFAWTVIISVMRGTIQIHGHEDEVAQCAAPAVVSSSAPSAAGLLAVAEGSAVASAQGNQLVDLGLKTLVTER